MVTAVPAGESLSEAGVDGGLALAYGAHTFLSVSHIVNGPLANWFAVVGHLDG